MENVELNTNVSEIKKKKMPWWKKTLLIIGSTLGSIIAVFLSLVLVLNVFKSGIYFEYYSMREVICTNHGLEDNYNSQGTAVTNDGKYVLTSGYMSDKTNSRIYIIDVETDTAKHIKLVKDGKVNKYHMGDLAISDVHNTVYLASNNKLFMLNLNDVLNAEDGAEFEIGEGFAVNNEASFVFTDDKYLFVGEFHNGKEYITENVYTWEGVTHNAITGVYDIVTHELLYVISIRDKVQGFAVSPSGGILLSTSYGLPSSEFYFYKADSVIETQELYDGVPLYFLGDHDYKIVGPAMSEGLDYRDGLFYTNFESSCNKYFFGKLFIGSNYIVGIKAEK